MNYKQLNLHFKPTPYETIVAAYKKALPKIKGTPNLNEWVQGIVFKHSKRILKRAYLKKPG